jgi:hypothetical protein
MGLGVGLTTLHCIKEIVEKPPRNSAGFCGGGQGLSWAVEPRKEEEEEEEEPFVLLLNECLLLFFISLSSQTGKFWMYPHMYIVSMVTQIIRIIKRRVRRERERERERLFCCRC